MGRNARGSLVFGVPLGGSDEGWLLSDHRDEDGYVTLEAAHLPWLTPEQVDEFDGYSYAAVMELGLKHLRTLVLEEGDEPLGAGFEVHQHGYELGSFALVLASPQHDVEWGDTTEVNLTEVIRVDSDEPTRARFRRAFEALSLRPAQPEPTWFLTADYF